MDVAWVRANQAVPVSNLRDLQLPTSTIALLVTAPGCEHCATFETEYFGIAEQVVRQQHGVSQLVSWSCSNPDRRQAAQKLGVDDVPCIVILPPANSDMDVQLHDAFKFTNHRE